MTNVQSPFWSISRPTIHQQQSIQPFLIPYSATPAGNAWASPKGMEQDAMWFRVDIQAVPDGYEYEFEDPDLMTCGRYYYL